jgi:hypothetical protein
MRQMLHAAFAAALISFGHLCGPAAAQQAPAQIKLTEAQIEGFIAAQKDLAAIVEKMQAAASANHAANKAYEAAMETATKKHGFKNLA